MASEMISMEEVAKNNTEKSCWVVIGDGVYDVTAFLKYHPGGAQAIMHYAGADATDDFHMLHPPTVLPGRAQLYLKGKVKPSASTSRVITAAELGKHSTRSDCWTSIHGKVYNVTPFLADHPGGENIMVKYAGKDSTNAFVNSGHPTDIVSQLGLEHLQVGVAGADVVVEVEKVETHAAPKQTEDVPPIDNILSLFDIEAVARMRMGAQGWNYYSSGADDEITMRENRMAFQRIWFKPRALVNVKEVNLATTIMGFPTSFPLYITACALGRFAHPEGEVVLTRGAHAQNVIQMCPTLASCTLEEMTTAAQPGQIQFFQLYVNHDRKITEKLINRAKAGGIKVVAVTVDAPQLGRREKDMRNKFTLAGSNVQKNDDDAGKIDRNEGAARTISAFIDPSLNWDDLAWIKKTCHPMKVMLKGVQCGEDAVLAVEHGMDGIICSNHGGRQMDFARAGIEVLEEVMEALKENNMQGKLEVLVDGGIRRGSDIIKAIALGATGVGIGRPSLYGMASYGQDGVEKVLQILKDEMVMGMRLIGAPTVAHIKRSMVITKSLSTHTTAVPTDGLANYVYEPLRTTSKL